MLIDFNFSGKEILVVGGGEISYRKIKKFLESQPKIKVVSRNFTQKLLELQEAGKVELIKCEVRDAEKFLRKLDPKPFLVVAATNDRCLNAELASAAKAAGCMVYVVDNSAESDFTLPATADLGDVKIAISTGGKSPAIAGILRRKIEKAISEEDILQIRLQSRIRRALKAAVPSHKTRKQIIYKILKSDEVSRLLKEKKLNEAYNLALKMIKDQQSTCFNSNTK